MSVCLFANYFLSLQRLVQQCTWQTYWKCFRTVLSGKCGSFSITTGQRTALISCLDYGKNAFCVSIPHIYSSVGYGSSFILLWVCHNLLINKRNRLHAFFFVNRLIGACQQEIRLYDRRSLEVSKLRKFRANRWHDAADVVTGLVEREIAGRDTRIKSVKFM